MCDSVMCDNPWQFGDERAKGNRGYESGAMASSPLPCFSRFINLVAIVTSLVFWGQLDSREVPVRPRMKQTPATGIQIDLFWIWEGKPWSHA